MPLYEYECESCKRRFERIQKFSDPPVDACPVCGAPVRKLPSSPAIQFKGSGFYITDYGKDGKKDERDAAATAKTAADTKAKAAEEKKAAASATEAKPASGDNAAKPAKPAEATSPRAAETVSKPATTPAPAPKPTAPSKKPE